MRGCVGAAMGHRPAGPNWGNPHAKRFKLVNRGAERRERETFRGFVAGGRSAPAVCLCDAGSQDRRAPPPTARARANHR